MIVEPSCHPLGGADTRAALVWRFGSPVEAISSAPVGGGWGRIDWVANIGVTARYARTDLAAQSREVAGALGLLGCGATCMTAVDVTSWTTGLDDEVRADATVGVSKPTWAADADGAISSAPGTINLVVQLPVALQPAAAVNAVMTATEAKSQALLEHAVPGTGTASDAVVITWPVDADRVDFAGPRSAWGARIARAVHRSVSAGLSP